MSKMNAKVRRATNQQLNPYQREQNRNLELHNRQKKLITHKAYLERKLQTLKIIEANIKHNGVSCPNRTDRQFEQCPATMFMQSHLSDNGGASRECSPIKENTIDHTLCKTHNLLNECESATRMKCVNDRNASVQHLSPCGYNLLQGVCAHTATHEQACTLDNCQPIYTSTGFVSSSSGYGRADLPVSTAGVKLDTGIDTVPVPMNQARSMSTQTEIIQDRSFEINHTQEDVKNYLQGTSSDYPVCAGGSLELDDVLDVISKHCQPLNSQSQDQSNHYSGCTGYPLKDSSSRSEEQQYRSKNRQGRHITVRESCIKSPASPSKAEIIAQPEDAVVEKNRVKSDLKVDVVNVVMQMVEILKIDDMRK